MVLGSKYSVIHNTEINPVIPNNKTPNKLINPGESGRLFPLSIVGNLRSV